jgi:hypothetical protein
MECYLTSFLNRYFVRSKLHGVISCTPVTLTLKPVTFHKLVHHKSVTNITYYKETIRQHNTEVLRDVLQHKQWEEEETLRDHESDGHSEAGKLPQFVN